MAGFYQQRCAVVDNQRIREGFHVLTLESPEIAAAARPGQFVGVRIDAPGGAPRAWSGPEEFCSAAAGRWPPPELPLVRRPFSFHDCFPAAGQFQLHLQIVGEGTAVMARSRPGQTFDCLGPLGAPVELRVDGLAILVGGGIGLAPFPFFARALRAEGRDCLALAGARSASLLPLEGCERPGIELPGGLLEGPLLGLPRFEALGCPSACSIDAGAPLGFHGFVSELTDQVLARLGGSPATVYACGPWPMMRATAHVARRHGAPCWLLLEEFMGCGAGACMSCVVPVGRPDDWRYQRVCVEGPAFCAEDVVWST